MTSKVHQFIVGATTRDAITTMAIALRRGLPVELQGCIYSYLPPEKSALHEVEHFKHAPVGSSDDVMVYHLSFGFPEITDWLISRPEKLVIVYHNVTPSHYYEEYDESFAKGLAWARQELKLLRPHVQVVVAVSKFNARELEEVGYQNVHVVATGLNPKRLQDVPIDVKFLGDLQRQFPDGFLLMVSQVLPHKRMELALDAVHLLRSIHGLNVGLVIAGPARNEKYNTLLKEVRARLPEAHVLFTGEVSEEQLATLYRHTLCYLSTSDHEGLAIPPLEAMAEGAPTVVRGTGAVPETVAGASVVVPEEAGVKTLTDAILEVLTNEVLRSELRSRGFARVGEFDAQQHKDQFLSIVQEVLS